VKIGEFFVENNYVTQEEVNEALELQKSNKRQRIGAILVKMNVITNEQLSEYVSEYIETNTHKQYFTF
jgi:hypothetical protein